MHDPNAQAKCEHPARRPSRPGTVTNALRGALPIARFGTPLDEAAAQILTSAIFRAPATTTIKEGDA